MNQFQVEFQLCVRWRVLWLVNFVLSTSSFRIFHLFTFDIRTRAQWSWVLKHFTLQKQKDQRLTRKNGKLCYFFVSECGGKFENFMHDWTDHGLDEWKLSSRLHGGSIDCKSFQFSLSNQSISHEKVTFSAVIFSDHYSKSWLANFDFFSLE